MLQKFQEHIAENFPFLKDKKLLIAISGGIDSVVLTHLLSQLNFDTSLAHCNFQLRENDSDLDEKFAIDLGEKLNIKTFTTRFNTGEFSKEKKLSTQTAARELRYNWFEELIEKHTFDYVLTAHHADDNLETFLINLTRGTGLEGLTGIPTVNGNIVRPLLVFSREEIETYANENQLKWREDASNSETKYLRNKIRHEIVPKLKEINPSLLNSFNKTSEFLQQSQQIIEDKIEEVSKTLRQAQRDNVIRFDIQKIKLLSNPKAYLYQLLKEYNFTEWNDIESLLSAQSGKQVFSKTHRLLKDREFLLLSKNANVILNKSEESFSIQENQSELTTPIHLKFEENPSEIQKSNHSILVDKDLLKYPLFVRKWQKGDYFCPAGMHGKKKLSKYFKDEKLSLLEKENIWLLCNAKNDIIWVIGMRQDNRFLTSKSTKNKLQIQVT